MQEALFKDFIDAIKKNKWTSCAKILFFGERNTGHEIGHMSRLLSQYSNTYSYRQKTNRDFGIWTDNALKISFAMAARLEVAKGNIYYMDDLICTNRFAKCVGPKKVDEIKHELESQAARYKFVATNPKSPHSIPRITVTGKTGKSGVVNSAFNDDLVFAFTGAIGIHEKLLLRQLENMDWSAYSPKPWDG
jgi:hypothetical protein